MKLKGQVLRASIEERMLVGKDGMKASHKIAHILLISNEGGETNVLNCRTFDNPLLLTDKDLPKIGAEWTTPPVKKYECFDGQVAEVML